MPIYRNLWEHIGKDMPKKGRGKAKHLDPHDLPTKLQTALEALYGHYEKTFDLWAEHKMAMPPCFIIVCNNTATSKLVYDYVSGFERENDDGSALHVPGKLPLFANHDEHGNPLGRPKTLLIDSEQLESGEALDKKFRDMAGPEIERFKRERVERSGNRADADNLTDADLLREVMNTVGKAGQLGESIRCVVSVSMLTEGWDANNVTHVLGVRAFGTQLLCEQVVGRALRRESYDLNEDGLFNPSYADVLGIPFNFAAEPVVAPPQPPRETLWVHAVRPERDALEIRFPRVEGYRVDLPAERIRTDFTEDSKLELTPGLIGPARVRVARRWIDECLTCKGGTYPAQLLYREIGKRACEKITAAITRTMASETRPIKAILAPYNPVGTTAHVGFNTSRTERYETSADKCHIDWVILDSGWEAEFCRVAESQPRVLAYVKNHNLGFDVPYRLAGEARTYRPDFIVVVDDGNGANDPLNLVVEIKGYRGEDAAAAKKDTMDSYWVPGVNHLASFGRWAFVEFGGVYEMQDDFAEQVEARFEAMIDGAVQKLSDHA
ncbi:MAG TPA: hypothetical protein VFJ08_07455 [Salinisphaera sp.]|nr:hypothetical protein [Salinisphaera sp.]HET7314173.1 hypothetical protein [Salinisphaera sp.]